MPTPPVIGQAAPDFSGLSSKGEVLSLSDFKGQYLILYFYPKDKTPGCTQEGIDFTTHYAAFKKQHAAILGVSRDSIHCHQSFRSKYDFPFELLADENGEICHAYDVKKHKILYGKINLGLERSTFLIDSEGKLVYAWRKVRVRGHVEAVLAKIKELQA